MYSKSIFYYLNSAHNLELKVLLQEIKVNPYTNYKEFKRAISLLILNEQIPIWFINLCSKIRCNSLENKYVHYIRNCPLEDNILNLNEEDPRADKINRKISFVSEAFLELFSQVQNTPIFAYETRNFGDFFQDVYPWKEFSTTNTVRSNGNISWHNDRTAHLIRASYIYLLGMYVPIGSNTITNYIHYSDIEDLNSDIEDLIEAKHLNYLKSKFYITEFDDISRKFNEQHSLSKTHAIFDSDNSVRFYEGNTRAADNAPKQASKALEACLGALYKAKQLSIKIETGGMLCLPNKMGLHNRSVLPANDKSNPDNSRHRWLLKTYNSSSQTEYKDNFRFFKKCSEGVIQEVFS